MASQGGPSRKASGETHLPTPQSGTLFRQQQGSVPPYQSTQAPPSQSPHRASPANYPTPEMNDYHAGPSTYRRTPNLHSPLSAADQDDLHSRGRALADDPTTPARKPKGTMTAQGEQVMMDGMERMQFDEGDGRIGTDEPCE